MATVNFLYRSTRDKAPLSLRLLYSYNNKKYVIGGRTQKTVTQTYWDNDHMKQRIKDIDKGNFQKEVKQHNSDLETFILDAFQEVNPAEVNKDWLKTVISHFYNPPKDEPNKKAPVQLVKFFDFYQDIMQNDLTYNRKQRLHVVKKKLERYEAATDTTVLIKDVNDLFKRDFINYAKKQNYSDYTKQSDLSIIKTVCKYARQCEIKTSPQLENLKIKADRVKSPYLNFDELESIIKLDLSDNDRLDNARDWLIISCYTGQRISDFMRFNTEMIQDGIIEIRQRKTGETVPIPIVKEVQKVLDKRNGQFPRRILDQKYNDHIKEVCKKAKINQKVKGSKKICIAKDQSKATRNDYRNQAGTYKKWELISSHIGRRSFATNYYSKVPTSVLMRTTGHTKESTFLIYIHRTNKEKAEDTLKYFEQWT